MRYIDLTIIDINDPEVKKWLSKAKIKATRLSALSTPEERKEFLARNDIWKQFKPILVKYFGNQCWYSEYDLSGDFGAVDHFRPKNSSKDKQGNIILQDGYWWLSYDYLNYRLSCDKCNTNFNGGGKQDYFPLKPHTLPASNPNKNDSPMILDPCEMQDVKLIDCDENGEIIALSTDPYICDRVAISKMVYNWRCFNDGRKKIRNTCKSTLETFEMIYESLYKKSEDKMKSVLATLVELVDNKTSYSSFAKRYIKIWIENKPYAPILERIL